MKQLLKEEVEKRSTELTVLVAALIVIGAAASATDIINSGSSPGLVAEYRFDTGTGDTAYDSAGNNDGEINGASWTDGVEGEALSFDGTNDTASMSISYDPEESFAVSYWIELDTVDERMGLMAAEPNSVFRDWYAGSSLDFWWEDESGNAYHHGTYYPDWSANRWQHVVFVYNGTHSISYINGNIFETEYIGDVDPAPVDNPLTVGDAYMGNFDGDLDNLELYSSAIASSQIKALYKSGSWRIGTNTEESDSSQVLDFTFQHQNSSHVLDTSGYNNHGTPQKGASQERAGGCKVGRCYSFSAGQSVDTSADVSDLGIDGNKPKTVMAWAKIDSFDRGGLWQVGTKSDSQEFSLRTRSSEDSFRAQLWSSGDFDFSCDSKDEWTLFALVHTGSETRAYCNGFLAASETQTVDTTDGVPFKVGEWSGDSLKGKMDQVKVFNRSLSQQEIIEEAESLSSEGTVLDLRFNRNGGDKVHDFSGEENHGTLRPNESSGPKRTKGITGNALEFDGEDDYIDLPNFDDFDDDNRVSMSSWIKRKGSTERADILNTGTYDTLLFVDNSGRASFYIHDGSSSHIVRGDQVPLNRWEHISGVYDGSELKIYQNGELTDSKAVDIDMRDSGSTNQVSTGSLPFEGKIDNLKLYPYDISKAKVQNLYNQGKSHIGSSSSGPSSADLDDGLVLSQTFNRIEKCGQSDTVSCPSGMSGEVAVDESGEANHGELVNGPKVKGAGDCKVSGCLGFDGSGDFIRVQDSDGLNITDSGTFGGWIYLDEAKKQTLIDKQPTSGDSGYGIRLQPDQDIQLLAGDGGTAHNFDESSYPLKEWTHIMAVFKANDRYDLFVNGEKVAHNSIDFTIGGNNDRLAIGRFPDFNGQYVNGRIDDMRVYNRSLSDQEVWKLYTQGRDQETGMAGAESVWRLDEKETAYDAAGDSDGAPGGTFSLYPYEEGYESDTVGDGDIEDWTYTGGVDYCAQPNDLSGGQTAEYHDTKCSFSGDEKSVSECTLKLGMSSSSNDNRGDSMGELRSPDFTIDTPSKIRLWRNKVLHGAGGCGSDNTWQEGQYIEIRRASDDQVLKIIERTEGGGTSVVSGWLEADLSNYVGETVYLAIGLYSNDGADGSFYQVDNVTVINKRQPNLVDGKVGKAMEFDGNGDYIGFDPVTLESDSATITGNFYIDDFEPDTDRANEVMFVKKENHRTHQFIGFGDGSVSFETNVNNEGGGTINSDKITSGEWFNAALVFDRGTAKLYVDGKYAGEVSLQNNDLTIDQIGYRMEDSQYQDGYPGWYDGKIDDIRIYPYALDSEQVKQVMNSGSVSAG